MDQEELLQNNEAFILRTASFVLGRPVTRSDDEYSIALSAFWEAAQSHDPSKGSLQTYASVVIRHRLIDYIRSGKHYGQEISVEPDVFTGEMSSENETENLRLSIEKKLVQDMPDRTLSEEIGELALILQHYQIDFFDLPNACPKARKTRTVCLKAARFVCAVAELLARLRRTLPDRIQHRFPKTTIRRRQCRRKQLRGRIRKAHRLRKIPMMPQTWQ